MLGAGAVWGGRSQEYIVKSREEVELGLESFAEWTTQFKAEYCL